MCDFISWIELRPEARKELGIDKKILFLEDDMAKVLQEKKDLPDLLSLCGHEAIGTYYHFPMRLNRSSSTIRHKESIRKIPREIVKAVNAGHLDQIFKYTCFHECMLNLYPDFLPRYTSNGDLILPEGFLNHAKEILVAYMDALVPISRAYIKKLGYEEKHIRLEADYSSTRVFDMNGESVYNLRKIIMLALSEEPIDKQYRSMGYILSTLGMRLKVDCIEKEIV